LRALGFDGVVRLLLGALKVELRVWLRLALGLTDELAARPLLRPDLVRVRPDLARLRSGDAAIAPLLRVRL
jgi:hypothetical protein|tara:strand:- start:183 stop:395 length:213 start_codon:yes stop_codon:yes gene_type:complete